MLSQDLVARLALAGIEEDHLFEHRGAWPISVVSISMPTGEIERVSHGQFDLFIPSRVITFTEVGGGLEFQKFRYKLGFAGFSTPDAYWKLRYEGRLEGISILIEPEVIRKAHNVLGFKDQWNELTWRLALSDNAPEIAFLGLDIFQKLRTKRNADSDLLNQEIKTLLGLIINRYSTSKLRKSQRINIRTQIVLRAVNYVNENLSEDLSVASIADMANASTPHLNRLFRSELGMSVWQYVTAQRLEAIRREFQTSGCSFSQAAKNNGYKSKTAAAKQFKKHFGRPPKEVRDHID